MQETSGKANHKWFVLGVLCTALFMLQIDGTIVNIAIPSIMKSFHTDISAVEWVLDAYILVFAVLLIAFGRLGDLYGRKLFFVIGLSIFTLGSALCGLSPDEGWLIAGRAVQGLGGAIIMPQTLSIITVVFPANQRGAAMGVWGGVVGIAAALGPMLGGIITERWSWPLIFFINLPIGVIGVGLALWIMSESKDTTSHPTVDWTGVFVVTLAMLSLTFALIEGQNFGWTSPTILGLFAAAVALLVVFFFVEARERQPLMDMRLFRNRTFTAGNISGVTLMFGFLGVIFLLTLFLQVVLEFSPMKAGLITTPASGMVLLTAPLAGRFSDKYGSKWFVAGGLFLASIGIFLLSQISVTTTWQSLILPLAIVGAGVGLCMAPLTSAVMSTVAPEKSGNASGILSTGRQLGALLGIAVLGAVLQNRLVAGILDAIHGSQLPAAVQRQIESQLTSGSISMSSGMTGGGTGPMADLMKTIFQQELTHAMNVTFQVAVVVMVVGAVAALLIKSHVQPVEEECAATEPDCHEGHLSGAAD